MYQPQRMGIHKGCRWNTGTPSTRRETHELLFAPPFFEGKKAKKEKKKKRGCGRRNLYNNLQKSQEVSFLPRKHAFKKNDERGNFSIDKEKISDEMIARIGNRVPQK